MNKHDNQEEYKIHFTKNSKYERVSGWDNSQGFLTKKQVELLVQDEKNMATQEGYVLNLPEHPLTNEGLKIAYDNLKDIVIHADDLKSIT